MEQPDFQAIAAQLRHPEGENGIKTAVRMSENNAYMITSCIDALQLNKNEMILELGPGGGAHLPYLFKNQDTVRYFGADISITMIEMATKNNQVLADNGQVHFNLVTLQNGYGKLPYEDATFDKAFTVNTIYFWDNAPAQSRELLRVLKPGGKLFVCFATEAFMEQLPFTQFNFKLYSAQKAIKLFQEAGYRNINTRSKREWVENTVRGKIERDFIILEATK